MSGGQARLAAGILEADFGNLYRVVRKLEKAGADRLHLDVMDGHFVPGLTFGPDVVRALRRLTRLPLDVHLLVERPSTLVDGFIAAGSDSITLHAEVPEPPDLLREALASIRRAGLGPGLAVGPTTPVAAVVPFADALDIVLVLMHDPASTVQRFRREIVGKIAEARAVFAARPHGWEVHVEGGIGRETADIVGGFGADILVVGSALFQRGHDVAREAWSVVATLPHADADELSRTIERAGIPTLVLRTGQFEPGVDAARIVMVPASAEVYTRKRFGLGFAEEDELL